MTECHNECEDKHKCYAQWTDMNGEFVASDCEHYWEQHMCIENGMDQMPDQCDYFECEEDCEGDCWVEKCNMEDECKEYSCTRWEFNAQKNYWSAIDCTPDHKDYSKFDRFFKVVEHYEESWDALQDYYCEGEDCIGEAVHGFLEDINLHPIDNNSEDIDEFLSNEDNKGFYSVVVEDTQEMLNAFGSGVDLDWMHTALSADNSDELKDMFDDIWEGYEEENSYYDDEMEGDYMFDEEYESEYEEAMEDAEEEWSAEEEAWESFEEDFEEDWSEDWSEWEEYMDEEWEDFEDYMDEEWEEDATTTEETEALMNAKAWGTERRGSRRH